MPREKDPAAVEPRAQHKLQENHALNDHPHQIGISVAFAFNSEMGINGCKWIFIAFGLQLGNNGYKWISALPRSGTSPSRLKS